MSQDLRKQNNKLKVKTLGKNNNTDKKRKTSSAYNKWKSYEKTAIYIPGMHVIFILVPYLLKHLKEAINITSQSRNQLISLFNLWKAQKKKKTQKTKNRKTYQQQKNANMEKK